MNIGPTLPITGKLSFGMHERQVLSRVGKPARTLRDPNGMSCWEYDLSKSGFDAVRVCFYEGRYSAAHYRINGRWDYKPRTINVTG